jgi:hypothetical protein
MDPSKRLTCEQLLEHQYFDNYVNEKRDREDQKMLKNQQAFQQSQNMAPTDRKSKPPGVSKIFFKQSIFLKKNFQKK